MVGTKGSNASKPSSKHLTPAGQQNLFQFYKKQPRPTKVSQKISEAASVEAAPAGPVVTSESRPLSPKEENIIPGLETFLSNMAGPSREQHPIAEEHVFEEEAQRSSNTHPNGETGDHRVYGKAARKISRHRPSSDPKAALIAPPQEVKVDETDPLSFTEQRAVPSTKPPPKRAYPIFDKRRANPPPQVSVSTNDTSPVDHHALPTSQAEEGIIEANLHDVVDLTESTTTASTSAQHSVIVIDDEPITQGPPTGSQDAPIDLRSSPPAPAQKPPVKVLHPFFAPRVGKHKDKDPIQSGSTMPASGHWEVPWPDADAQHNRGPQSCFWSSGSSPFGKYQGSSPPTWFSSQPNLRFLNQSAAIPSLFSERQAGSSSSRAPTSLERKDAVSLLPNSHRQNPGIHRLLDEHGDVKAPPVDDGELWTHRWRPRSAVEVLGNADNARYLKAWLHALEIRDDNRTQTTSQVVKGNPESERGVQRPIVIRAVNKKRGRKRRRIESDDGSSLEEWIVSDGEEETENDDDEPSHRSSSPFTGGASISPLAHMRELDADDPSNEGLGNTEFSQLTNTILLTGPPGSGKTSAVYACAEELGWEVFEVYPGIGKRSGANISSLVGDLGKNHLVGRGGANRINSKDQPFFKPGFGYLSGEDRKRVVRQSIILLEEVDILYKEDANFWPTVVNIIKSSRRPVFMTCNDISLVPQDELPLQTCLTFQPCPSSLAVSFLHCVCLSEGRLVPRAQLEAVYATTHEPIGSDEPDEPQVPYPSQPRPCSDLRRALNVLQFWCDNEALQKRDDFPARTTTSSWAENHVDWSSPPDGPRGGSPERDTPHGNEIDQIWQHIESASYIDGYLERRSSDVLEALSIDRYDSSIDDEIGYTLLEKPEHSTSLAFFSRDEDIAREALIMSRHVLEALGGGPRARAGVSCGRRFDSRSLMWCRVAKQTGVVSFLDDLIPLSAPLLPRAAAVLEYTPYVRQMVATDDAMETEASGMGRKRVRNTRNSWRLGSYPRYLNVSVEGLEAARRSVLQ